MVAVGAGVGSVGGAEEPPPPPHAASVSASSAVPRAPRTRPRWSLLYMTWAPGRMLILAPDYRAFLMNIGRLTLCDLQVQMTTEYTEDSPLGPGVTSKLVLL